MGRIHIVRQGDCIASIAFENGFFEDTVWDAPENEELKAKRKDRYVLKPGDEVYVPDLRVKQVEAATNRRHRFRRRGVPKRLRVQFLWMKEPLSNVDFTIAIDDKTATGKTDGSGWLDWPIPPNAKQAVVTLADGTRYRLKLGHLNPIDEIVGVQDRLRNLGLYHGPSDGSMSDDTARAIRNFQLTQGLSPTGAIDEDLKKKLLELSGE